MRRLESIWIVWTTLALAACSGSDANDERAGGADSIANAVACDETRTAIGSPEQVVAELGFSASDVLAFSAKEHQSMLRWLPAQPITYGPESGDVPLAVSLRYLGGPIHFVHSTPGSLSNNNPVAGIDVGTGCFDALAIEVEAEVATAGGALAERFTTEMRARTAETASIFRGVELDALDGTFEVLSIESRDPGASPDSAELVQPRLRIEFAEAGTQGRFEALVIERFGSAEPGFATGGLVEFAHWPADEL